MGFYVFFSQFIHALSRVRCRVSVLVGLGVEAVVYHGGRCKAIIKEIGVLVQLGEIFR
jgi:hypothetical protein